MQYEITVLTDSNHEQTTKQDWQTLQTLLEDELLMHALRHCGLNAHRTAWSRSDFPWSESKAVLFKTTWDYYKNIDAFVTWMAAVKPLTRMFNGFEQICWNINKKYLLDLAHKGIRIVETEALEKGSNANLKHYFGRFDTDQLILKPQIAGSAFHTYLLHIEDWQSKQVHYQNLLATQGLLIQPFQKSIMHSGEVSLIFIDGEYTHAVIKHAAAGDFRVQTDHGGMVLPYQADHEIIELGKRVIMACDQLPLYARVDFIHDNQNQWALMELELIEPELFFRFNQRASFELAHALKIRMASIHG